MPIEKPNDDKSKTNFTVFFEDGTHAEEITDIWVRQDGRWINLVPPDRLYYPASFNFVENKQKEQYENIQNN